MWTGCTCFTTGSSDRLLCEHGTEIWVSVRSGHILSNLATISFSRIKDYATWYWLVLLSEMCFRSRYVLTYNLQYPSQISTYYSVTSRGSSPRIKPRGESDNSHLSFAELNNEFRHSSTICLYGASRLKYFAFTPIKIFSTACISHPRKVSSLYVFKEVCLKVQFRRYASLRHE